MKRISGLIAILLIFLSSTLYAQPTSLILTYTLSNGTSTEINAGNSSFAEALSGAPLWDIKELVISSGKFQPKDWKWLRTNKISLNALTDFTITDGVQVGDIPDGSESIFSESIMRVSMVKVESIGEMAFRDCYLLEYAYFPDLDDIGSKAFEGCVALTTPRPRGNRA